MKKLIIILNLIVLFASVGKAFADIPSCNEVEPGETCSLVAAKDWKPALEKSITLPTSNTPGDSVLIMVGKKATGNAYTTLETKKAPKKSVTYQTPTTQKFRSPLSHAGI